MKPPVFSMLDSVSEISTSLVQERPLICSSSQDESDSDTTTAVKSRPKLKRPSLYKVFLLNDDYTPMEFVILVLMRYFSKSPQDAERIMLEVHHQGAGLAGIFPFEVAETKVFTVNEFSRRQKHPLKCTMEEQSSEEV